MASGDTTIALNSVTGLNTSGGILVIDRQDGNSNNTPTLREYISFTGVSGSSITGVTRGRAGSTAQSHNSGALVEENMSIDHWNDARTLFLTEHDIAGKHVISTATITTNLYASGASTTLTDVSVTRYFSVSGASLVGGFPINPIWVFSGGFSGASTHPATLVMPQAGNFLYVNALTRTVASGASVVFDILKNGTSIFAGITTPTIVGAGTFVSNASISTKSYAQGDVFQSQIKALTGGVITDVTLQLRGY